LDSEKFDSFKDLNKSSDKWLIKARLIKMGKLIKTTKGMDVLNLELIDCSQTKIHIAMFNDEAYKWITQVRENQVYKISGYKN